MNSEAHEGDSPEVATLAAVVPDPPASEIDIAAATSDLPVPLTLEARLDALEQKLFELSLSHGGQIAEHEQFIFELKAKQAAGFPVRIYIDAVCQHCGVRLNSPGITGAPTDVYQHPWEPSVKLNGAQCPHKGKRFKLAELLLTEAPPDARRNR